MLDKFYYHISNYMLQLSGIPFPRIGAISKSTESGEWTVESRPLTYNANEMVSTSSFPIEKIPQAPFDTARRFLEAAAATHDLHLRTQRNIACDRGTAAARYIARREYRKLIPKYCTENNNGPFRLFCDDFRPSNILVDPETFQITAVLGWEFTNAMPAQFTYDPPWWFLGAPPMHWIDKNDFDSFMIWYGHKLELFLGSLERAENDDGAAAAGESRDVSEIALSTRMRRSWESGQFWFDYATLKSDVVDGTYWIALHKRNEGYRELEGLAREVMEAFVQRKMKEFLAYGKECDVRFAEDEDEASWSRLTALKSVTIFRVVMSVIDWRTIYQQQLLSSSSIIASTMDRLVMPFLFMLLIYGLDNTAQPSS
jgi:hypothetical protein